MLLDSHSATLWLTRRQVIIPSDKQVVRFSKPASPLRSLSLSIPALEVLSSARYTVGPDSRGGKACVSTS
jgi:hypothetical protein